MKGSAKKIPFRFSLTPIFCNLLERMAGLKLSIAKSNAAKARYFLIFDFLSKRHAVAQGNRSSALSGLIDSVIDVLV